MVQLRRIANPVAVTAREQFCDCYEANYRQVRRYVARLSGDAAAADDVTQECFTRLWDQLRRGEDIRSPKAWLYRVASREVITRARSRQRAQRLFEPGAEIQDLQPSTTDLEADTARRDLIRRALRTLPEPMKQCVLLHQAGLTGKEIAEVLDVKPSYIGTLVVRGHERFRRECAALGVKDPLKRD